MTLVVILLFHDKNNKKLYTAIFFCKKSTLSHSFPITYQYFDYTLTLS